MKFELFLLIFVFRGTFCAVNNTVPNLLYRLSVPFSPAFCTFIRNNLLSGSASESVYDLAISSFSGNRNKLDPILRVEAISKSYTDQVLVNESMVTLTEELVWPNEVVSVPSNLFTLPYVWVASTGFFLPKKNDGAIALLSLTNLVGGKAEPVIISSNPTGIPWYYHRVEWHDMNGDGFLDAITERANGGGPSANVTQLVWFENPRSFAFLSPNWNVHVLNENVEDVHFRVLDLPYNGEDITVIISSGFYSNKLSLVWSSTNDFTNTSSIRNRTLDEYGWYFDVEIVDLNLDGKLDVLTSTWSQQGKPGAVLAYEIPTGDWTEEPWTRHVMQDGYKNFLFPGTGSPGSAQSFWPSADMENIAKPFIMVSGDDDGKVFVLTPDSELESDWSYSQTTIYEGSGTFGAIAVKDIDKDGLAEVIIPAYAMKELVVMSYKY